MSGIIDALRMVLPDERILTGSGELAALARDQSWLSPALSAQRKARQAVDGAHLGVIAAVAPQGLEELSAAVAVAARLRVPITLRGAGTSNFGLIDPGAGGLMIDLRGLTGPAEIGPGWISAPAGTLLGDIERTARERGWEVPVLTTTYASATVGGWVAGGHVGLGSSSHGAIWDGIVRRVRIMTVEESPRIVTLSGEEVEPVLHSFGVTGILTHVELTAVPARHWVELVGAFPDFAASSAFTTAISRDRAFHHRVVAAQEPAAHAGLRALGDAVAEGEAAVLAILDGTQVAQAQAIAAAHHGRLAVWQDWSLDASERTSIAALVYGHRMYWVKRILPGASFLHVYPDPTDPDKDLARLKARFGDGILIENKYIRSPWMLRALGFTQEATLPAAVVAVARAEDAPQLQAFCDDAGIAYQNPHAPTIEANGLFADVAPLVALKARTDPHSLIHPGRLASAEQAA